MAKTNDKAAKQTFKVDKECEQVRRGRPGSRRTGFVGLHRQAGAGSPGQPGVGGGDRRGVLKHTEA